MTHTEPMRRLAIRLTLVLVSALGVPASTSALSTGTPDIDVDTPRRADAVSASSLWDSPAAPETVVVQASGAAAHST